MAVKHDVWSAMRLYMGQEIDDFFSRKALEQKVNEDNEIKITKQDLNDLYFNIRERIERGIVIEENPDVKTIEIKL